MAGLWVVHNEKYSIIIKVKVLLKIKHKIEIKHILSENKI